MWTEGADVTYLTQTIIDTIRSVGHHIGQVRVLTSDGRLQYLVRARNAKTNEKWTVTAPTEYEAACELAQAVGFDLMDG